MRLEYFHPCFLLIWRSHTRKCAETSLGGVQSTDATPGHIMAMGTMPIFSDRLGSPVTKATHTSKNCEGQCHRIRRTKIHKYSTKVADNHKQILQQAEIQSRRDMLCSRASSNLQKKLNFWECPKSTNSMPQVKNIIILNHLTGVICIFLSITARRGKALHCMHTLHGRRYQVSSHFVNKHW